jgi:hypothetical protein
VGLDESSRILVTSARAQELSGATKSLTADNLLIRDQQRLVIKSSGQRFSRGQGIL